MSLSVPLACTELGKSLLFNSRSSGNKMDFTEVGKLQMLGADSVMCSSKFFNLTLSVFLIV